MIDFSIELGLLYLREGRLDEADDRFAKLEREQFPSKRYPTRTANVAGQLGRAVVASYRDTPRTAQESNALFLNAIAEPVAKPPIKGDRSNSIYRTIIVPMMLNHLDLGQAVSEALNRNALALGKTRLEPNVLELLRSSTQGREVKLVAGNDAECGKWDNCRSIRLVRERPPTGEGGSNLLICCGTVRGRGGILIALDNLSGRAVNSPPIRPHFVLGKTRHRRLVLRSFVPLIKNTLSNN